MSSVFTKTLYDLRWTILAFCVGLGGLGFVILYLYPLVSIAQEDMMEGMSEAMAQAMLGGIDLVGRPEGHLNMQLFTFHPLYISVFLIITSSAAVAGEENAKTLGLLLARPVARWRVLLEKAGAILVGLVAITAVMIVGLVLGGLIAGVDLSYGDLVLSLIYTLPYGIWLIGFGLFCSALFRSRMTAALIATAVVISGYMLNSLTEFVDSLHTYNYASPIYYYAWAEPFVSPANFQHMAILIGAGLFFLLAALVVFERREIHG